MFDLISIGNVSIDLFFKGDSLTFHEGRFQLAVGGKYEADFFHRSVGGGGANVAIGASKHRLKTTVWSTIGDNPFKKMILDQLRESHVATNYLMIEPQVMNISSIFLTEKGERTIVHYNPQSSVLNDLQHNLKDLKNARMVYLGNLAHTSLDKKIEIARKVQKEKRIFAVNLGIDDCRKPKSELMHLLPHADIIILNGHEFAELVKAPYNDIHFHEHVVKWYIPELVHKVFVVTESKKGSFAYVDDNIFHVRAADIERIIDSTGAGDAYTAGFLSYFLRHNDIEGAMVAGTKHAGIILQKVGAN